MPDIEEKSQEIRLLHCHCGASAFARDGWTHTKTIPETIVVECLVGAYEVWADGRHEWIPPGCMFVLPPMHTITIAHHWDGRQQMQARWVHVIARRFGALDVFANCRLPLKIQRAQQPDVCRAFDALHQLKHSNDQRPSAAMRYQQQGLALCAALLDMAEGEELDSGAQESLAAVYRFIEEHMHEAIQVADLARCMHLSPARFYVVFKELTGQTPKAWLQQRRLERAAHLLLNEDSGLDAIADRCGLANAFHLSRLFKRSYGQAPGSWRREHLERLV